MPLRPARGMLTNKGMLTPGIYVFSARAGMGNANT